MESLRKKLAVLNLVVPDMDLNPSIGMGIQKGNIEVFGNENNRKVKPFFLSP